MSGWNLQAMPLVRTAVTAGDHIDWITVSPEAIRLTLSLKSFQKARNWPAFLASISVSIVRSISFLRHVALVGIFVLAGGLHDHRRVHDADRRDVEDRGLALELRDSAARPSSRSGGLIRSGRMPSVSAL